MHRYLLTLNLFLFSAFSHSLIGVPTVSYDGNYAIDLTAVNLAGKYWKLLEDGPDSGWTAMTGIEFYKINYVSNKKAGVYSYKVNARTGKGGSISIYPDGPVSVTVAAPPMPTALGVPATDTDGNGSFLVSWPASIVSSATFELQRRFNAGAWSTVQNSTSLSKAESNLAAGEYEYQLRACSNIGCSTYSATHTITVLLAPSMPTSFTVPSSSTGAYNISWAASLSAENYTLQEKIGSGNWTTLQFNGSTNLYLNHKSDNEYSYQVNACNAAGCSGYTAAASSTTVIHFPLSRGSLIVPTSNVEGENDSVYGEVDYFEVQARKNDGNWMDVYSGDELSITQFQNQCENESAFGELDHYELKVRKNSGSWVNVYSGDALSITEVQAQCLSN